MNYIVENLQLLVRHNISVFSDADSELEQLKTEHRSLKALLKDVSKKLKKDETCKDWKRRIREVIFDIEDTFDSWYVGMASQKAKDVIRGAFSKTNLAKQVKSLREDKVKPLLEQARANLAHVSLPEVPDESAEEIRNIRQKKRQNNIVGFEDEADTLIGYLKQESEKLEVISIVGMPGLGKTTLAWKIFKDPRVEFEFHTRIWVNISEDFNIKNVLHTVLSQFTQPKPDMTIEEQVEAAKRHLANGKFLIVMDDIWTGKAWEEIKAFLPMKNGSGRVLITSRHKNVAYQANPMRKPHKLRFLTEEESWLLLQYEVYDKLEVVEKELADVGKAIAKLCDGLPLSIIVIGGILVDRISIAEGSPPLIRKEWEEVSKSIRTYLIYEDKNKRLENIIALSYTKLPYELRDCFLYLGIFPDGDISARKLTLLWIAEGFIQEVPGKSLEEVSLANLKDLINRNLVMVEKTKPNGEAKTCRIHDTIRQFCKTEAAFDNQNLFQEIRMSNRGVFEPKLDNTENICRRLCIHSDVHEFLSKKRKVLKAHSFLCFPKCPINLGKADISLVTDAFRVLRVLDAKNIKFPKFPPKLMQLFFLRYLTLALADDQLKSLPEAISNLLNLQTLIVDIPSRTIEIKADIWKMMHLRHLKTKASIILKKDGKGEGGENLQTLNRLAPESCTQYIFGKARNLITLGVKGDISILFESKGLEKLVHLNKLKLVHDVYDAIQSPQSLGQLPDPNKFPPGLRILVLAGTYLDWEHISVLGSLESLEELKLKDNAFAGKTWHASGAGFCQLEFLHMERANLVCWTASADAFPKLRNLAIKNCDKLTGIPLELSKNLEMLCMERVTDLAVSSAKKIEQMRTQALGHQKAHGEVFKLEIAPADQL